MIDERIHGFCEFVGTRASAKQHLEYLGIGLNGVRSACRRATQKERVDALRVLQSKFLRDHATHGNAEDVRALDAGSIEHGGRIRGHQRDGIRSGRHIAPAHAPIVERYRPIVPRENWPCTVPHRGRPTKAHDQQNGRSPTLFVPVDPGALIIGKRHWRSSAQACGRVARFVGLYKLALCPLDRTDHANDSRLHMRVTYRAAIVYNAVPVWQIRRFSTQSPIA